MATNYNGRRAPNVSQYIANLNTIPSAADLANQQDFAGFEDDLAMFTNTQFFDFDMNENVPEMSTDMSFAANQPQPQNSLAQDPKNMNYVNRKHSTNTTPQPCFRLIADPAFRYRAQLPVPRLLRLPSASA